MNVHMKVYTFYISESPPVKRRAGLIAPMATEWPQRQLVKACQQQNTLSKKQQRMGLLPLGRQIDLPK